MSATPESLSLIAMRDHGRFPGLSPHSVQDPGSKQQPQGLCLSTSPSADFQEAGQVPSGERRKLGSHPGSASNSPGDLDEVTFIKPVSYCARRGV